MLHLLETEDLRAFDAALAIHIRRTQEVYGHALEEGYLGKPAPEKGNQT